jgi:uncharacterized RDD family membrane protein YckC
VLSRPRLRPGTESDVLHRRAAAVVLDVGLWLLVSSVPVVADLLVYTSESPTSLRSISYGGLVFLLYLAITQGATGQTVGKYLLGVGVGDTDGGPCSWRQAAGRSVLLLVDIALLGLPAVVSMALSDSRQRVGDRAAGTVVVRAER